MVSVNIPLETEVLRAHENLVTGAECDGRRVVVKMDVRKAPWEKILQLPRGTRVHWADVREVNIQELSSWLWPMHYQLTYGDGWYVGADRTRTYFPLQPHLRGLDLVRQCTTVTLRAAILLAVMAGVGLRTVGWLMDKLFHVDISKSALDRWVKECAAQLPDAAEMARVLNDDQPITEGHFDEIFPTGQRPKRCTLVLRDEHGRIIAVEEVEERNEKTVAAFLTEVKSWGLKIRTFYVDGCEAYRKAIKNVFPEAVIQYDYFHVIQGIFRKLREAFVGHRRDLQERSEQVKTPAYSERLAQLAKRLWDHRGLVFKNPDNMTPEENQRLCALIEEDRFVGKLRGFMGRVWGIFEDSESERGAIQRLNNLKRYQNIGGELQSPFAKAVAFLEERFTDMTAFLRHSDVKRNSLAETGIRCLRRLERGHDGFRGSEGLDCYVRIYQSIKYLNWDVYRTGGSLLGLPYSPATAALGQRQAAVATAAN
jgi:hypothetical protein